jgi:L-ascorbate metabolism protein UlaG (beta-lactamase superfamily)
MSTKLTVWGHACVRLESSSGRRLVIDPGAYSDRAVLEDADAVLVTHEHGDHVVPGELRDAVENSYHLEAWAPQSVIDQIAVDPLVVGRVHRVRSGDAFLAAGFGVLALGESHVRAHPDLAPVTNLAYLVDGAVLHPGDSFTEPPAGTRVDVLLAPLSGPWLKVGDVVDYVRAVGPRIVVPIHDAMNSEAGNGLADRLVATLGGTIEYRRLGPGDTLTFG